MLLEGYEVGRRTAPGAADGGCGQVNQGLAYTHVKPCEGVRGVNGAVTTRSRIPSSDGRARRDRGARRDRAGHWRDERRVGGSEREGRHDRAGGARGERRSRVERRGRRRGLVHRGGRDRPGADRRRRRRALQRGDRLRRHPRGGRSVRLHAANTTSPHSPRGRRRCGPARRRRRQRRRLVDSRLAASRPHGARRDVLARPGRGGEGRATGLLRVRDRRRGGWRARRLGVPGRRRPVAALRRARDRGRGEDVSLPGARQRRRGEPQRLGDERERGRGRARLRAHGPRRRCRRCRPRRRSALRTSPSAPHGSSVAG